MKLTESAENPLNQIDMQTPSHTITGARHAAVHIRVACPPWMQFASRDRLCSGILFAVNGSTPMEQKLAEALTECDRLREENRQLRDRLGMPTEKKLAQPNSAPATTGSSAINSKSSPDEKVKLFRSLFRGRDDVYAVRWEGCNNGKSGHDLSVTRFRSVLEHRDVAVANVFSNHGIARHPQCKSVPGRLEADGFDGDGNALVGFRFALAAKAGWDRAEQRDFDDGLPDGLDAVHEPERPGLAGLGCEPAFLDEGCDVTFRRALAAPTEFRRDFPHRGRGLSGDEPVPDELEDAALGVG